MVIKTKVQSQAIKFVQSMTTWRNDQKETQYLTIYPVGNANMKGYEIWDLELTTGEEITIPSDYDCVIQQLDKHGKMIIGGLAPQLTNVSRKGRKLKLHPSLDVEAQKRKYHMDEVVKVSMQKKVIEETLSLMQKTSEQEEQVKEEEVLQEEK